MAKKSLSEQLSQLTKPQTEFDIEDNDLRDNVFNQDSEDNSESEDDDQLKKEHYVDVSKSKMRQNADSVSLGKKYTGNITNRSNLYDDEAEEDEDEEESDEQDEDEEELNDEEEEVEDEEEANSDNSSDSGESLRDNSESEAESDSELNHKRLKVKQLMTKERSHIVNRLSQSATNDSLKGFAISQQHKFFDKIIDCRLKAQKSLTNSNLLPPNKETLEATKTSTKKTAKYLAQAKEDCFNLLDSILSLRNDLLTKDHISTESIRNPKKRSLEAYTKATTKLDSHLNLYRSNVLTKWSAKVQNSSGSTAINAGKFKAINQSFEQQVVNNLTDMDRLVKRTRLNRRQIQPLGYKHYQKSKQLDSDDESEEEELNLDIPKEVSNKKESTAEIDEIFDDEDFYRVLLNDLVDKKIQSSNPTTGLTISLRTAQKAQKFKNNVDTKASKGRKLRFHVQEQIANFDAPSNGLKWDDNQMDEFFASLLGQKVNMNEVDEDEDDEDELVAGGDDGIKLFG